MESDCDGRRKVFLQSVLESDCDGRRRAYLQSMLKVWCLIVTAG